MLRERFDFFSKAQLTADILRAQHLLQCEIALHELEVMPFGLDVAVVFDQMDKVELSRRTRWVGQI